MVIMKVSKIRCKTISSSFILCHDTLWMNPIGHCVTQVTRTKLQKFVEGFRIFVNAISATIAV